ncbi:hypothetical protein DMB66_34720 [Actinoplanes sp. ATCC 53533]|uniref:hypothetical protein n=1 Tax=Actinoplanes sp. ATCC 53533 TaxID=1288362 RepID=UPI000F780FA4|nr:hypothetical protein [Actinoplanes sp. ATCC 53533]RSM56471.1 hypothetical protein DMB66_34720 [Actinoplanes sp. ATCC 53533]
MPEELTEEQTRAAFALMRAEDLTYIRPPGSAEALRAVRRRRRTSVAAVAAGVVIAVAGSATVAALVDTDRTALPPATPSPSPSALSKAQLDHLAAAAAVALGIDRVDNEKRKLEGKPQIISSSKGPVRSSEGFSGSASSTNKNGGYVVEVVCVGEGTIRAQIWAAAPATTTSPAPDTFEHPVTCSDKPTPIKVSVRAPKPKLVYVRIQADPSAVGRAAFARLTRHS